MPLFWVCDVTKCYCSNVVFATSKLETIAKVTVYSVLSPNSTSCLSHSKRTFIWRNITVSYFLGEPVLNKLAHRFSRFRHNLTSRSCFRSGLRGRIRLTSCTSRSELSFSILITIALVSSVTCTCPKQASPNVFTKDQAKALCSI